MESKLTGDLSTISSITDLDGVYFQFDEDEPIIVGEVEKGKEFSLTLRSSVEEPNVTDGIILRSIHNMPSIEFSDAKGKTFRIFLKSIEK